MPNPEILKRVRALMARAVDPGATEEEQRTSAHIAAKLCRQHGISLGELGDDDGGPSVTRTRSEVVIDGVRVVEDVVRAGGAGLESVFGFNVFGFAQELLRERAKETIASAIKKPAPRPSRRKPRKR